MGEYIKSPINYTGNKYRLLGQIIPLMPKRIGTFADVFGGSGTVLLNANAERYIYNEYLEYVYAMFKGFVDTDYEEIVCRVYETIDEYGLTKTNEEGYAKLRDDYNCGRNDWVTLYVLCCYAFNSQGRFGRGGKFNMPFGKNRSSFSDVQKDNILKMKMRVFGKNFSCFNLSFEKLDYSSFGKGDFVYFDPPYYGSLGVYNEKRRMNADGKTNEWTEEQEKGLASIIDRLDSNGVWFGVSNNLRYGNPILERLCGKYRTYHLGSKYNNSSYHKTDRDSEDDEVFVTNFELPSDGRKPLF